MSTIEHPQGLMPVSFEARLIASATVLSQGVGVTKLEIETLVERMKQYMIMSVLLRSWVDGELEAVGMRDGEVVFTGSNNIDAETRRRIDLLQASALDALLQQEQEREQS